VEAGSGVTKYSYAQLEQIWIQNGGSVTTAPMAAAIAMAESGGDSNSHSGTDDWGLWQINKGGPAMLDPAANARTAVQMSQNGQNWRPWCTAYADAACGTRGGAYLGSKAPFWKYLQGQSADLGTIQPIGESTDPTTLQGAGDTGGDCLWKLPSVGIGPVHLGGQCLVNRSQGRALLGAVCLVGGGLIMVVGAGLLLAGTKAGRTVLQLVPNPVAQGAAAMGGASASRRDERREQRAAGRAEQENLRAAAASGELQRQFPAEPFPEGAGDRELQRRSERRTAGLQRAKGRPSPVRAA
jgi:hypothetical protein